MSARRSVTARSASRGKPSAWVIWSSIAAGSMQASPESMRDFAGPLTQRQPRQMASPQSLIDGMADYWASKLCRAAAQVRCGL